MPENKTYRACIVGLTGIGAGTPPTGGQHGFGPSMPHAHAAAYSFLPETEIVGVCDLVQEKIDDFTAGWSDRCPGV